MEDATGSHFYKTLLKDGAQTEIGGQLPEGESTLIWDSARNEPLGFSSTEAKTTYTWLDPILKVVQGKLEKAFKGKFVLFHNWSEDMSRIIFSVQSSEDPGGWFLYDGQRGEVSPLGESYPELAGQKLGEMRWIHYPARDGLSIPAYLTTPPGSEGKRLPLIVMPHGGPASRDTYGFDWWAQFLVSRGYAVLQPEFRGSTGFGPAFTNAGEGEWGGKMQTDLLDGIAYLKGTGAIDSSRVCVIGASFGGFAALAGVTLHPESYRCAVAVSGVSDPLNFITDRREHYGVASTVRYWRDQVGSSNPRAVAAMSPVNNAGVVVAPVLLIHGEDDTTVPFRQSLVMNDALKAAGADVTLVKLDGDDHFLSSTATRTKMLEAVDTFLKRVMPVQP